MGRKAFPATFERRMRRVTLDPCFRRGDGRGLGWPRGEREADKVTVVRW